MSRNLDMQFKSREDIEGFILEIEKQFPVNNWKYQGMHIWPILRIRLEYYLEAIRENWLKKESAEISASNEKSIKAILSKTHIIFYRLLAVVQFYFWLLKVKQKKFLFVSMDHYRTVYKNKRFNKFFDPLIEQFNLNRKSALLEMGPQSKDRITNRELSLNYSAGIKYYFRVQTLKRNLGLLTKESNLELPAYNEFLEYLKRNETTFNFAKKYSPTFLKRFFLEWTQYYNFFLLLLKRLAPEKIFILCYFDHDKMALTAAANQLGIATYEMQHGPLNSMAYHKWSIIPNSGYDMLPRNFWCWDEGSKNIIDSWAIKSNLYHAIVGGNPWLEFWKTQPNNYTHNNFILYTLQPLQPERLFPDEIINFIKNEKFSWFIRLHPLQFRQKSMVTDYLKSKGVYEKVNIENASYNPLPLLLKNALLHITRYSGTVIEAELFNVYSVIIHATGSNLFNEQIDKGKAEYIDIETENFGVQLKNTITRLSTLKGDFVPEKSPTPKIAQLFA